MILVRRQLGSRIADQVHSLVDSRAHVPPDFRQNSLLYALRYVQQLNHLLFHRLCQPIVHLPSLLSSHIQSHQGSHHVGLLIHHRDFPLINRRVSHLQILAGNLPDCLLANPVVNQLVILQHSHRVFLPVGHLPSQANSHTPSRVANQAANLLPSHIHTLLPSLPAYPLCSQRLNQLANQISYLPGNPLASQLDSHLLAHREFLHYSRVVALRNHHLSRLSNRLHNHPSNLIPSPLHNLVGNLSVHPVDSLHLALVIIQLINQHQIHLHSLHFIQALLQLNHLHSHPRILRKSLQHSQVKFL